MTSKVSSVRILKVKASPILGAKPTNLPVFSGEEYGN
jgi:hypothetical protein